MDKLPSGVPPGADGAFERFLTAALATIITIMFSWRLLAEEEEAAGRGEGPKRPYRTPQPFPPNPKPHRSGSYGNNSPDSGNSSANVSNISDIDVSDSEETDTHRSRSTNIDREFQVRESVISEYYSPVNDRLLEAIPSHSDVDLSFSSQADDTVTDETLTTWDEYKWEEELGQEKRDVIKTRRSVRDFVKSANNSGNLELSPTASTSKTGSHNNENALSPSQDSPSSSSSTASSPCVPFTQRFANFEYKDMGGDSGYIDLYPDVESDESDSSDDENVYDLQVSDSDSSSEDERADRGTAFYGLTSLDTIMEEYESDTDICDRGHQGGDNSRGTGNKHDNSWCLEHSDESELNRRDNKMDTVQVLEILEPKIENVKNSYVQMSQNDSRSNAHSSFQNETFIKSSQAEKVKCNISPDIILKADDKIISPKLDGHPRVSKPIKVCDLSVNNTGSLNSGMLHKQENEKYQVNLNNVSVSHTTSIPVALGQNDQRQINFQNNEHHEKVPKLKLTENEYTVSEISDDSLPPSPINRTCALDNPTDELFSDTESCCESVITVLSVRSNDSETTPHDRYDVTSPFNALIIPTTGNEDASGQNDHSLVINDKKVDTLSPYEQNSLVSGFLNDSLNSLLSANTGSNDTGSENDLDQHSTVDVSSNTGAEPCLNSQNQQNTQNIDQSQISCIQMNGTNTSDNSSAESLPLILADAQQNNPISQETGNQNVNGLIEINSESSQNCHRRLFEQIDNDEIRRNNQHESDNWSDTSDPPLREYDPDDDDLAAFQFNIDSDDEDSLYLIVGDEGLRNFGGDDGGLRNFETFTNLNSIGLSPEYSDAVPSHTVADDGHGFTFSVTEQENTEFRKRTYVTDRSNMSDSDTRSDGLVSPVLSDIDDESKKHENEIIKNQDKTEQTSPERTDQANKQKVDRKDAYQDADLSLLVNDTETIDFKKTRETESRSIDFKKYIIHTDKTPVFDLDTAVNTGDSSTESGHKDVSIAPVSDSTCYSTLSTEVDTTPANSDTLGVISVNNETRDDDRDGQSETLASLTEKIRSLSVDDDTTLQCASSDQDSIKIKNSVTAQEVDNESDKELKRASIDNDSVDAVCENEVVNNDVTKQQTQSKETNIDDFVTTESLSRCLEQRVPIRETNIDDIYNENTKLLKANSKKETNIDEILDKQTDTKSQSVTNVNRETNNSLRKLKVETNIDDILNDDTTYSNTSLVGKPASHLETNVDELFNENVTSDKENISKNKQLVVLETCVDDIVVDVDNIEQTDGHQSLSYETFVDDLFDNIVPSTTSQTQSVQHFITSESSADNDKSAIQTSAISDHTPQHSNQSTNSNHELPLKPATSQPISINSPQIEHSRDVHTSTEPEYYNGVNRDTLSARETTIPEDYGSDIQPIKSITNVTYLETLPNIPRDPTLSQNFGKLDTQQNISDLTDNSRDFKDRTKTPDTNGQNNSKSPDYKSDNIDNLQSIKNDVDNEYKRTDNEIESLGIIKAHGKNANEQLTTSLSEKDNNVNENQLKLRDHNGNVAVPKDGILNGSPKTKFLGLHPGLNNRNNFTSNDNSLEAELPSGKSRENVTPNKPENYEISNEDIELKIVEDSECLDSYSSIGSCSLASDGDESLSSLEDSYNSLQESYTGHRLRGLSDSAAGRVVRSPATKPSDFFAKSKNTPAQGVKKRIRKHNLKKYSSILQQPITPERVHCVHTSPEQSVSLPRLKVLQSRQKFLSAENLATGNNFEDKFLQHRTSLVTSTPRKYLKRHERNLPENQSTESLPTEMSNLSLLNSSYDGYSSMDRMHSLPSPRHINDIYASRFSSANSSYEKPDHQSLHANCMFSPQKREEIRHTTKSLENMFEQLLRYGSVSSLAETDLDAADVDDVTSHGQLFHDSDYNDIISFQYPLERAASMSALYGSSDGHRLPREPRKGRFASRQVPKSKSLQTLETNLDDVFADENELSGGGELKKTPSVHELRVSKSLSKLAVPDWFKKSSFSRSGSTQSLFTYAGRQGSTSTLGSCAYPPSITSSPSTSVTPCSNTVIIQKRVTPSPTTPSSARLIRAPMLPMTPEKAPIHNTSSVGLPSDKYRQKDSKKDLKPIAIIPFSKLREMFERKSSQSASKIKSPVQSPTKETAPKVRFEAVTPTRESNPMLSSPSKETVIDDRVHEPVQIQRTISPTPDIPERRPILTDNVRKSESVAQNSQPRKTQVHFSDEPNVSKPQEQNTNTVRQNGTAPSPSKSSNVKKPSSLRTSLPLPQFRFRRPGVFATKASTPAAQNTSTQSKKGKPNGNNGYTHAHNGTGNYSEHFLKSSLVHALEHKAKTDGETLFEFLQKRRYSSLLENGFAEQLDELQDRDVTFNFPVLSLGKHSNNNGGIAPIDGAPDLQVILTNAYADNVQNDYVNNKLRGDASLDEVLDGLLIMDGQRTGRMRIGENGRIVPKMSENCIGSPDTPPGLVLNTNSNMCNGERCL